MFTAATKSADVLLLKARTTDEALNICRPIQQFWKLILLANLQLIVNAPLFPNYATLY